MDPSELERQASEFAEQVKKLLDTCLPGETSFGQTTFEPHAGTVSFETFKELTINGHQRASISAAYRMCANSTGEHLAVDSSAFKIEYRSTKRPVPIVRFEYDRHARNKPASHFQFHADSVPLGILLVRAGCHDKAVEQSKVHYPMGGPRFRVCLEDIIELVIREFGAESQPGWEHVVQQGRKNYRAIQEETVIRQHLPRAITMLENMGYTITPPADSPELIETETPSDW